MIGISFIDKSSEPKPEWLEYMSKLKTQVTIILVPTPTGLTSNKQQLQVLMPSAPPNHGRHAAEECHDWSHGNTLFPCLSVKQHSMSTTARTEASRPQYDTETLGGSQPRGLCGLRCDVTRRPPPAALCRQHPLDVLAGVGRQQTTGERIQAADAVKFW